jgi:hypothetical protein
VLHLSGVPHEALGSKDQAAPSQNATWWLGQETATSYIVKLQHDPSSVVSREKNFAEISYVRATVSEITYCKARFLAILGFSVEIMAQYSSNIFFKKAHNTYIRTVFIT